MKTNLCKPLILSFILAYCISNPSNAQSKADTTKSVVLEEVVVTGTKTAVNRNNVPLSVSVVIQCLVLLPLGGSTCIFNG